MDRGDGMSVLNTTKWYTLRWLGWYILSCVFYHSKKIRRKKMKAQTPDSHGSLPHLHQTLLNCYLLSVSSLTPPPLCPAHLHLTCCLQGDSKGTDHFQTFIKTRMDIEKELSVGAISSLPLWRNKVISLQL